MRKSVGRRTEDKVGTLMRMAFRLGLAFSVFLVSGCAPDSSASPTPSGPEAEESAANQRDGTILRLEGWHGTVGSQWVQAGYKVKREAGQISKALSIEIEDAPSGVGHVLTLDGFTLGKLKTNGKGEAEYELAETGSVSFPEGFTEPKDGSLLRIGELGEIRLRTVHRVTDLQVDIAGPGKLAGKVSYKVERTGETINTEFQVRLTQAGAKSVQPVRIDGVHVGDLEVESGGKAKLTYSTLNDDPFPTEFHAPKAGSTVEIGELYKGQFRDDLTDDAQ